MDSKNMIRALISNYFVIMTGTFLGNFIYCSIFARDSIFTVGYLGMMFVFGFLGDIPLLVFYSKHELSRKEWRGRQAFHVIMVEAVLLIAAYYLEMYHTPLQGVVFAIIVLGVYVMVNTFCWHRDQTEANRMNSKLESLRETNK